MKRYDLKVWEKAEHWYFYTDVAATDIVAAKAVALKHYPRKYYTIIDIREHR
jgi:hypothetical protein